jgi:cytochrome b561
VSFYAPIKGISGYFMIDDDGPERYDRITVLFHWLTAGLVLLLWGLGQGIDLFPRGTPRVAVRSVHILLGAMLGVVLLSRIVY